MFIKSNLIITIIVKSDYIRYLDFLSCFWRLGGGCRLANHKPPPRCWWGLGFLLRFSWMRLENIESILCNLLTIIRSVPSFLQIWFKNNFIFVTFHVLPLTFLFYYRCLFFKFWAAVVLPLPGKHPLSWRCRMGRGFSRSESAGIPPPLSLEDTSAFVQFYSIFFPLWHILCHPPLQQSTKVKKAMSHVFNITMKLCKNKCILYTFFLNFYSFSLSST